MKVDLELLVLKLHYFLLYGGTIPVYSYLGVYGKQMRVSEMQMGMLFCSVHFICAGLKPLLCAMADYLRRKKAVLQVFLMTIIAAYLGFALLPQLMSEVVTSKLVAFDCSPTDMWKSLQSEVVTCSLDDDSVESKCALHCPEGEDVISFNRTNSSYVHLPLNSVNITCPKDGVLQCYVSCEDQETQNLLTSDAQDNQHLLSTHPTIFWVFCVIVVICWTLTLVSYNITDVLCFQILGEERKLLCGQQMAFGMVSMGIFSFLGGLLVGELSENSQSGPDYAPLFYLMIGVIFLDILVLLKLADVYDNKTETKHKEVETMTSALFQLLKSAKVATFLTWCLVFGSCMGIFMEFQMWLLDDIMIKWKGCRDIFQIKLLQGLSLLVQGLLGEASFTFLSGWFLRHLGHSLVMSVVLAVAGVRFFLCSSLINPWFILPIDILQGPTVGLGVVAMISYTNKIAPRRMEVTLQGLSSTLCDSLGMGAGSIAGGTLYQIMGGRRAFMMVGTGAIIASCFHIITMCYIGGFRCRNRSQLPKIAPEALEEAPLSTHSK